MLKFATILAASASLAAAAPAQHASGKAARQEVTEHFPSESYLRYINSGETISDPHDRPLVVKNGNFEDETSTIATFQFGDDVAGKTCQLVFELDDDDTSEGTKTMDVFNWTNPEDLENLVSGKAVKKVQTKSRDEHAGRILVSAPGTATWIMNYGEWPSIPCPAGELIGIEFVGVGDEVEVAWVPGVTGPRFLISE